MRLAQKYAIISLYLVKVATLGGREGVKILKKMATWFVYGPQVKILTFCTDLCQITLFTLLGGLCMNNLLTTKSCEKINNWEFSSGLPWGINA